MIHTKQAGKYFVQIDYEKQAGLVTKHPLEKEPSDITTFYWSRTMFQFPLGFYHLPQQVMRTIFHAILNPPKDRSM